MLGQANPSSVYTIDINGSGQQNTASRPIYSNQGYLVTETQSKGTYVYIFYFHMR